ncbi:MAG: hypothetical protein PHH54_06750 [Candidatus Nanoarchaeia archaeon]|nr:hypothetical protein [Candidatus Nanoarchaeia archaeon]MDD5741654.1 hypothetical protein [Candidatus Nanoarchaeia archaeon]
MDVEQKVNYYYAALVNIIEKANNLKNREYEVRNDMASYNGFNLEGSPHLNWEFNRINHETRDLIREFNRLSVQIGKDLLINIEQVTEESLHGVTVRGSGILAILKGMISPLKPEQTKEIGVLRERINKLEIEDIIKKNLLFSLKEIEEGHSLASMLISGRIIDYCISKLVAVIKDGSSIIEYLEKSGKLADKKEDIKKTEKNLIEKLLEEHNSEKSYRNRAVHNIYFFPEIDEAFRELSNSIRLASKL